MVWLLSIFLVLVLLLLVAAAVAWGSVVSDDAVLCGALVAADAVSEVSRLIFIVLLASATVSFPLYVLYQLRLAETE